MGKWKICVYAISKNEEQFVDRWMDAVSEADLVVVVDTGSSDKTVEKLRARGANVYEESITPWRFDAARNRALDRIPEDFDICVSNDLDEVFEPGWRKILEEAWTEQTTRARYTFVSEHFPDGSIAKTYAMEKIHSRHGFRWVHPVHEVLSYRGEKPDQKVEISHLILHHYPDIRKPRSQYLPLLELSVQENPENDRAAFWLGREYFFYQQYDNAIFMLEKYLNMPTAIWEEERSAAMRFLAKAHQGKGQLDAARAWLFRSIAECPNCREPYCALAQLAYDTGDWCLCWHAVAKGLDVKTKTGSYLEEADSWGSRLYDLGAIACYQLGLGKQAEAYAKTACEIAPDNERLKRNLNLIQQSNERSTIKAQ